MTISVYSKNRLKETMSTWRVEREYGEVICNYLINGWEPGSFFTSLLANDCMGALSRSHPGNSVQALKNLVGWIQDQMPRSAWGSYEAVEYWTNLTQDGRRHILEMHRLIYTEKEETWMAVKGETTEDPLMDLF